MFSFNAEQGVIRLYDVIGESWDGSGIHAAGVAEALDQMDGKRVTVRINSPGGIADEGVAIYNTLKAYPGGVDTVIDALAASAASIVALAGKTRTTMRGARWMIHRAMGVAMGNAMDLRRLAEMLDVYDNSIAEIYGGAMRDTKDAILSMMDQETWFDGSQAMAIGLATAVDADATNELPRNAAWFANAPANLRDSAPVKMKIQPISRELARLKLRLSARK